MAKRKAGAAKSKADVEATQPPRAKSSRLAKSQAAAAAAAEEAALPGNLEWRQAGGMATADVPHMFVLSADGAAPAKKCAAFDIDWCVVKPKSGGKWPKGSADWCWLFDGDVVPERLRKLHAEGYRLLFISNQSGFEKGTTPPKEIMNKCELVIKELGVPVDVILVGSISHYRKPDTGAWEFYVKDCNGGVEFDKPRSLFVGDAAGRGASGSRKKDFSCSDRMFAANIGLAFHTPEEFFLGEAPARFDWGAPAPRSMLDASAKFALPKDLVSDKRPELVLTVGPPACGKSTLAEREFAAKHGYVRVNRDTLKTPAACLKAAEKALLAGQSVIVDNTNPAKQDRAPYLELAKKLKIPVRCLVLTTDKALAEHLNLFRQSQTKSKIRRVPLVAYRVYYGKYCEPSTSEGFSQVLQVPFVYQADLLSDKEKTLIGLWTTLGH